MGDPTPYAGSAPFNAVGRIAYPVELVDVLVDALALDGAGRLLDVGWGPGSLTLLLAPHFAEAVGVDPDTDMLAEAADDGCFSEQMRAISLDIWL